MMHPRCEWCDAPAMLFPLMLGGRAEGLPEFCCLPCCAVLRKARANAVRVFG